MIGSSKRKKAWIAAALVLCAGAAASCDRSDPVAAELERVSIGYDSLSTSGSTPLPSSQRRREVYQWGINRLTGKPNQTDPIRSLQQRKAGDEYTLDKQDEVPGDADQVVQQAQNVADAPVTSPAAIESKSTGQAAAANLLVARGQSGLAEIAAQEASRLEGAWLNDVATVRASLDQWLSQTSVANALVEYDPAQDFAKLDAQIAEKQAEAQAARADKATQDAVVADLRQRASAAADQAKASRDQELEVRSRAQGVSQTAKAALIEEAAGLRREADRFDAQSAALLAEASKEQPEADEIQKQIDRAARQVELLERAKDEVRGRVAQAKAESDKAHAEARQAAAKIDQDVVGLSSGREAALSAAEEAVRLYSAAVASARKASQNVSRDGKAQAMISAGSYQQAAADVLAARARGIGSFAALLAELGSARPALPNAPVYAGKASEMQEELATARQQAKEAYEQAKSLFESSGASGQVKENLDALGGAISRLLGEAVAPEPTDAPPTDDGMTGDAPPAAPDGAAAAADTSAEEAEIRAAIDAFTAEIKAGRYEAISTFITFPNDDDRVVIETLVPMVGKFQEFDRACQEKWNADFGTLLSQTQVQSVKTNPLIMGLRGMTNAAAGGGFDQFTNLSGADAQVTVTSPTRATVGVEGQAQTLEMVKTDGAWKVEFAMPAGVPVSAQMMEMFKPVGGVFDTVTGNIRADKYSDADAMLLDLNKELLMALSKMQGMPPPPPAPPPSEPGGGG